MPEIPQLGFGTSGLRGPAEAFRPETVAAFLDVACVNAAWIENEFGRS